ncbi:hypothetical protein [Saccharothrix stipae]
MSDSGFALRRRETALSGGPASLVEITARSGATHPFEMFRELVELFVGRDGAVLLAGRVDWREPPGRPADADATRLRQRCRPADLAHSLGPRFACVRLDDLVREGHEDFVTVDQHGAVVPRAQRLLRLPQQRPLLIRFPENSPVLIGSAETVGRLAAAAPGEPPPAVHRAPDTPVDHAAFHHLWHGPPAAEYFSVERLLATPEKWPDLFLACGIGKTLGSSHAKAILTGGATPANFVGTMLDDATPIDHENRIVLLTEPTDAQCAADIRPLLPTMDRARWLAFRAGYLCRRPAGQRVFDLVERGEATGRARAAGDRDRPRATDPPAIREDELALNFARALALTGHDDAAAALHRRVVSERTARLGADHPDTLDALAAPVAGDVAHRTGTARRKRRWWRPDR